MLDDMQKVGKKVMGYTSKGMGIGKKIAVKVGSIADKVHVQADKISKIPFIPEKVQQAATAVANISARVSKGSSLLKKGISSAEGVQQQLGKAKSAVDVARIGTSAFRQGQDAVKVGRQFAGSTRKMLDRPFVRDSVSMQKSLQPIVPTGVKIVKRMTSDVPVSGARGISRFRRAVRMAKKAGILKK